VSAGLASLPLGVPIPFTVWAPRPSRIDLVLAEPGSGRRVEMVMARDDGDWWQPAEPLPDFAAGEVDYGFALDGGEPIAGQVAPAIAHAVGVRAESWMTDVPSRILVVSRPHHASGV